MAETSDVPRKRVGPLVQALINQGEQTVTVVRQPDGQKYTVRTR